MNLVTGATGILGSHVLLHVLQNNQPVLAARQKTSDTKAVEKLFSYYTTDYKALFEKIKWVEIDLRDIYSIEDALEGVDTVYHCAGFVSFDKRDRKKLIDINEGGTRNLVNACLKKKTNALCHVSSIGVINNLDYTNDLNEDVFWKRSGNESDYAISKYNAEREVWRGIEEGLNAVIVNPGVILGPGFWNQSSARIFNTCYKGTKFYAPGTTAYIAAPDVARLMVELIQQTKFGQRFILAENNYSFKHIFELIHKNFNKPLPTIGATRLMLNLGRRLDNLRSFFTGKAPTLTKALVNSALNSQKYSNKKLLSLLQFSFSPVEKTLHDICAIYLSEQDHSNTSN